MRTRTLVWGLIIIIAIALIWLGLSHSQSTNTGGTATSTAQLINSVDYACSQGKTIHADYYQGQSQPSTSPDMPPTPGGSVALKLSDGRSMTLAQTISADGTRYSDGNPSAAAGSQGAETIVFWSKGNGATITEGTQPTYTCILAAKDTGGLPHVYENGSEGFSIRYPDGYTVDPNHSYTGLGPNKSIHGVAFKIASSTAAGTNLSSDSYLSVEELPQAKDCSATAFIYPGVKASTITEGDTTYSFASSTDAGAGNRYEEHVYAIPGTNPCVSVRYFIHYAVFENFPPGSVQRFDEAALLKTFDSMRQSLTLDQMAH
jgi:membrane-bound inhibitor of C-type lysozyme